MNHGEIKVSIIVPIYNVEKYLRKCLDSIIDQTYYNIEIILVNDGSADASGVIADQYAEKDSRIRVIHQENSGVSIARNVGIDAATGDYICFSDADDYLLPEYVEYLLEMAVRNDADVALTREMYTTFRKEQVRVHSEWVCTPEEALVDILTYRMPIGVYCKIFKRSFLGNVIRFSPELFIGEGFNFNSMAFQRANKVVQGNRKVYFYRRDNPTSATTKFSLEKWENAIFAIKKIRKEMILHSEEIERAWEYANWHTHCDAFNFLVMAGGDKQYRDVYKAWKKVVRSRAGYAFCVDVVPREKVRAIIMLCVPRVMPWLIDRRNKAHANGLCEDRGTSY